MTPCCCWRAPYAENALGRYEQAKADMEQAMRLSPRDPIIAYFHVIVRDRGDRPRSFRRRDRRISQSARRWASCVFRSTCHLAAAYALAGKMDEAKAALAEAAPPRSQAHGQMDDRTYAQSSGGARRRAEGGARGRMSETRKLAAILAADVVGYSRLVGADEERTLARLWGPPQRSHRPRHHRQITRSCMRRRVSLKISLAISTREYPR